MLEWFLNVFLLEVPLIGIFGIVKLTGITTLILLPFVYVGKKLVKKLSEKWDSPEWFNIVVVTFLLSFMFWFGMSLWYLYSLGW